MVRESLTMRMEQRNTKANGNRIKKKDQEYSGLKKHMTTRRKKLYKLSCIKNMREIGKLERALGKALLIFNGEAKLMRAE